jgi:hypothetical protein
MWLSLLMLIALIYTTSRENWLVACRIWYCEPGLVLEATIGRVPIEA